jgi:hypothetical protein
MNVGDLTAVTSRSQALVKARAVPIETSGSAEWLGGSRDPPSIMAGSTNRATVVSRIGKVQDVHALLDRLSCLRGTSPTDPMMARCFADAFEFVGAMPLGIPRPALWTDRECEVVFEWIGQRDHAIVSLEGDGILGYAMRINGQFVPGSCRAAQASSFPEDLLKYLHSFK